MRIGIDGYNLAMRHGTGIATYGFVLAEVLRSSGHAVHGIFGIDVGKDVATREVLFFDRLVSGNDVQQTRRATKSRHRRLARAAINPFPVRLREVPLSDQIERGSLDSRFPYFARLASVADLFEIANRHFNLYGRYLQVSVENPPDVMHWTYPVPIRLRGVPNIYTIHDVVPLKLPFTTLDVKEKYRRLLTSCIEDAELICTVSEKSREDIAKQFDINPERVVNTYQTALLPPEVLQQSDDEAAAMIQGIFGLKREGYFLYFGAIEPKKNLGRLIEAYLSTNSEVPLVLVGSRSWQADEELRLIPAGEAANTDFGRLVAQRVIRIDHLPRALLLRLIRGARAVLFPSLYEGFGLPVLEAMQLGTPVLTSRTGALPEVAGDAAIFVDPYDVRDIASALIVLDADEGLRGRLSTAGPIEAARFSAARYRTRLEALYSTALDVASARRRPRR